MNHAVVYELDALLFQRVEGNDTVERAMMAPQTSADLLHIRSVLEAECRYLVQFAR